jgi:hypothetical protein
LVYLSAELIYFQLNGHVISSDRMVVTDGRIEHSYLGGLGSASGQDSLSLGEDSNSGSPEYEAKVHRNSVTSDGLETFHEKLYTK